MLINISILLINISRFPIARAFDMTPEAARRHIYRERRLHLPPLPRNFEELGDMLIEYPAVIDIFCDTTVATDGSIAHIFASNNMMNRLNTVTELFTDGTFRVNIN